MTEIITENPFKFNAKVDKSHMQLTLQHIPHSSRLKRALDTHSEVMISVIKQAVNFKKNREKTLIE
jgi:hypothetical protein